MARFRRKRSGFTRAARGARRFGRRVSRNESTNMLVTVGSAMVYGGARQYISNAIAPVTSKIPLGSISDEVGLGIGAYLLHRMVKNKMVRAFAKGAIIIESARVGEAIVQGQVGFGGSTTSAAMPTFG